eukprot:10247544-Heterocapsa_arctica.AAC.1
MRAQALIPTMTQKWALWNERRYWHCDFHKGEQSDGTNVGRDEGWSSLSRFLEVPLGMVILALTRVGTARSTMFVIRRGMK